jgi:hypothetical protein
MQGLKYVTRTPFSHTNYLAVPLGVDCQNIVVKLPSNALKCTLPSHSTTIFDVHMKKEYIFVKTVYTIGKEVALFSFKMTFAIFLFLLLTVLIYILLPGYFKSRIPWCLLICTLFR